MCIQLVLNRPIMLALMMLDLNSNTSICFARDAGYDTTDLGELEEVKMDLIGTLTVMSFFMSMLSFDDISNRLDMLY